MLHFALSAAAAAHAAAVAPCTQVGLACAIAGIVSVQLVNVDVKVGSTGAVSTEYTCLLGADYKQSSLCV